jgi:hypothetical protein
MIANKLRSGSNQPTKEYTASGALANGDLVILNADNTVSVVEGGTTTITQAVGSPGRYNSATSNWNAACFDSNSNKVVVSYLDGAVGNYGNTAVGTVSGTSISFGSPVVFDSNSCTRISTAFDSNVNKVVVIYVDVSNVYGRYVVGTVSGTSISFGSIGTFNNNTGDTFCVFDSNSNKIIAGFRDYDVYPIPGKVRVGTVSGSTISFGSDVSFHSNIVEYGVSLCATFDSNSNKLVAVFRDNTGQGKAVVGTVSGTSISFGSVGTFNAAQTAWMSTAFDSNSNKVVIAFRDISNANKGTAIVGTVSGTSISFGSEVIFNTGGNQQLLDSATVFDPNSNKIVIAFRDVGNSNKGTAIVGTVSGTSISFGSEVVFHAAQTDNIGGTFDSDSNQVVISYKDEDNSGYGEAVVWRNASTVTTVNLTASNFVGISDGAYADTATATIQTNRATDNAQSGLTAGSTYYAQTDGTLSTSADSPSVSVGVARTTTSIKIKGSNA